VSYLFNSRIRSYFFSVFLSTLTAFAILAPTNEALAQTVVRGPYLQMGTPTSMVVRWRTDTATTSSVRYGAATGALTELAENLTLKTEHVISIAGLTPNTRYYYSVGTNLAPIAGGDSSFYFVTSPTEAKPTRVWVLGDPGLGTTGQAAVRNAYTAFTGARETDVLLTLGDNAYNNGTDAEYQNYFFNIYPTIMRNSVLWPTIGNHDSGQVSNPPASLPYFNIFSLPQSAQAGGVASGTSRYYSFDYGNIHFVCLDSMTSDRSVNGAMMTWLRNDLTANTKSWLIAFWHHPPYSKGSHDSDTSTNETQMRQTVLPVLEQYGVDLVLSGHSHSYERSFLIDNHYGLSNTFSAANKKNAGDGREGGAGAYTKPTVGPSAHEGTVYAVAGSSGTTSGGSLNHPAMFISLNNLGSMVLDVDGNRLDAKFLRETGAIADSFTLLKGVPTNQAPSVVLTSPANGSTALAPAAFTLSANASDADGTIARVDFYQGATLLGSSTTAPYVYQWNNVTGGTYAITARAFDNVGTSTTSLTANVTVTNPAALVAAPTNLVAIAASRSKINLTWADNATNESGYQIERSSDGISFTLIATKGANVKSYTNSNLIRNTPYFYRVRAISSTSSSDYSNTATATTKP
jgi:hypothetical protein